MSTERSRIARLRRLAAKDGCVFSKLRSPCLERGMWIQFLTADARTNTMVAAWDSLEAAEDAFDVPAPVRSVFIDHAKRAATANA